MDKDLLRRRVHSSLPMCILLLCWAIPMIGYGQEVDPEEYRPRYHLDMPGDPSGCLRYNGQYHLFTWDHVVSTDLVHWTSQGWPFENGPANVGYWTGSMV
ncbi:MAG: hypothetical protein KJ626_14905, partial [Verrucomicrobia bacterium]|nr:hypothetical protein [Verrucomicrobiota bacterium]